MAKHSLVCNNCGQFVCSKQNSTENILWATYAYANDYGSGLRAWCLRCDKWVDAVTRPTKPKVTIVNEVIIPAPVTVRISRSWWHRLTDSVAFWVFILLTLVAAFGIVVSYMEVKP